MINSRSPAIHLSESEHEPGKRNDSRIATEWERTLREKLTTSTGTPYLLKLRAMRVTIRGIQPRSRTGRLALFWFFISGTRSPHPSHNRDCGHWAPRPKRTVLMV